MATVDTAIANTEEAPQRSRLTALRQFARRNPLGVAGGTIVIVMIIMAVFADLLTFYNPTANDFSVMHEAPSAAHWLGTDAFGRDVLSRLIYGSRTALLVGFGLIIVVVRNEILDGVFRKESPEFLVKLRRKCFVVRYHQRRALSRVDDTGDRESLAATGDAEQNLIPRAVIDTTHKSLDCLRLVATGTVIGFQDKRHNQQ